MGEGSGEGGEGGGGGGERSEVGRMRLGRESGQVGREEGGGGMGVGRGVRWGKGGGGRWGRDTRVCGDTCTHTMVTAPTALRLICFACPVPSLVLPGFSPPPSQPVSADDMPSTSRPVLR